MAHQAPARGAMDGIRQDLQKAKDGYTPNGVGNAYSHNFLNQKPWHPANFRNQAKVYEAQQQKLEEEKKRAIAKAEFQAEQEYLKTLSYLSPEEQEKFKERQGVQFLYMKPPGADSMPAPTPKKPEEAGPADGAAAAEPGPPPASNQRHADSQRSHLGNMLGAMRALRNHDKWDVKHVGGIGRSPPRGTADASAENQQFVATSLEEEPEFHGASQAEERQPKKRRQPEDRLAEAEEVLRRAGIDVAALREHKSKKRKKDKKEKRERREKQRSEK